MDASHRRIVEEMGMDCEFEEVFSFLYKAEVGYGLIEHEYDHVFIGVSNIEPMINKEEVELWKYVDIEWLKNDITTSPEDYTEWFKIAHEEVLQYFANI
jgi:isopentenyl-diphosphate Delta-isomerase